MLSLHDTVDMHAHVRCHRHVSSAVTTQLTPHETHMEHFLFLQSADPPAYAPAAAAAAAVDCFHWSAVLIQSSLISCTIQLYTGWRNPWENPEPINSTSITATWLFRFIKNRKSHFHPFSFISFQIKWIANLLLAKGIYVCVHFILQKTLQNENSDLDNICNVWFFLCIFSIQSQ